MSKLDDLLAAELAFYEPTPRPVPPPSSPSPPTPSFVAGGSPPKPARWPLPRLAAAVVLFFLATSYLASYLRP